MRGEHPSPADLRALLSPGGTLDVRVTPKASADRITVERTDGTACLRIHVTTAPEDGKANKAVLKLLAKALGVPKSALGIVRGETSRDKVVRIRD